MKPLTMDRRGVTQFWPLAAAIALIVALPARADSVTDWNAVAGSGAVLPRFGGPQQQTRAMAIVQIAVHDALNSIDARYRSYNALPGAASGASADAAVAAAAKTTLLALIDALAPAPTPVEAANRIAAINVINSAYLAAIGPDIDGAEAAGIAAGELAANTIIHQRHVFNGVKLVATDGAATPNSPPYALAAGIGIHQPTPAPEFPDVTLPAFTGWPFVRTFAVNSASQFRAPPGEIFDIQSNTYTEQYNQVKHQGDARVRGAFPDSKQSDIARFWPGGGLDWNANARLIAEGRGLDRWEHARLFALLNVSTADSMITNLESKYFYNFWRPVTAIRWPDDGNPNTESDPNWRPFLQTPPYPDYPCASTSMTGAATQALRNFFGTNALSFERTVTLGPVPLPAPMAPLPAKTITRKYHSMSIVENEQSRARVYGGLHFVEGCYVGISAGNEVANWVYTHQFQPL